MYQLRKVNVHPVFDSTILGKGRKSHLLRAALLDSINDSTRMKAERVDGTERGIWTLGRSGCRFVGRYMGDSGIKLSGKCTVYRMQARGAAHM